jgi:hypothetical protein
MDNLIAEGLIVESFKNNQSAHNVYTWNEAINGYIRKTDPSLSMIPNTKIVHVVDVPYRIAGLKKKNTIVHESIQHENKCEETQHIRGSPPLIMPKNYEVHVDDVPQRTVGVKKKIKIVQNSIQHEFILDEKPRDPPEPFILSPKNHDVYVADVPQRTVGVRKHKVKYTFGLF